MQIVLLGILCAYLLSQLGGLHSNAYISDLFAKSFATEGMKAYVELIQRREADIGCDVLTHQKVGLVTIIVLTAVLICFFKTVEWSGLRR